MWVHDPKLSHRESRNLQMHKAGKRYGQLEPSGATPSFSTSYNSCGQNRKISIGVTVQEALAGISSEIKRNGDASDPREQSLPRSKNKQENIRQVKPQNGQRECSIQKAGEWISRSFHNDIGTVSLCENRGEIVQLKDGVAKKIDCVTYTRKCKDKNDSENVEAFVFTANQEMHVRKKNIINCKAATEENGHIRTKQHTESLRMKLWDILQTVPSHPDDGNADTKEKPKQSSDTIETDSERPIQKPSKPIIHLASQRKRNKKVPALLSEFNAYQFHPSSCQEKPPQKNVFAFTGEEEHRKYAVSPNRNSSDFKKKDAKRRNLIKPRHIQYSPETVAEKEHGKNEEKPERQRGSPVGPSPSPQKPLTDKHVPSPVEVNESGGEGFDIPMVRNGKEKERQDDSTTMRKVKSCGKGFIASSMRRYGARDVENSPPSKVTDTREQSVPSHRKRGGDKDQLETSETNKENFYISKKSELDTTATRKDNSDYYKKPAENTEDLGNDGAKAENFQCSPVHGDNLHVSQEIPESMDDTTEDNETLVIRNVFVRRRRQSHAYIGSSDDATEDNETLARTPPLLGTRKIEKNSSSPEQQNTELLQPHRMTKGETSTFGGQEKPLFLLRRNIRVRHQSTIPKVPVYTSVKEKEESMPLRAESQQSHDALASAIIQFAAGLERFKMKLKSHTKRKTSDILSSTTEKVQAQLQNVESQIHMELEKLTCLSRVKRKKLETRLQEQQGLLQKIHAKFKEDVSLHLEECMNVLGEMEADQTELRATAEKQKATHRKLLLQVQEEIGTQLGEAERRIRDLNKDAKAKMQQLKRALTGAF